MSGSDTKPRVRREASPPCHTPESKLEVGGPAPQSSGDSGPCRPQCGSSLRPQTSDRDRVRVGTGRDRRLYGRRRTFPGPRTLSDPDPSTKEEVLDQGSPST